MSTRSCRRTAALAPGQAGCAHVSSLVRVCTIWPSRATKNRWPMLLLKQWRSAVCDVAVWFIIGAAYCAIVQWRVRVIYWSILYSCSFNSCRDLTEHRYKSRVSPFSLSEDTGVSGAMGPHTLLTKSLVTVTVTQGAASLPFTVINFATLQCWCWWRPWTNTAIWIQLVELSTVWVSVRASPLNSAQASRKL